MTRDQRVAHLEIHGWRPMKNLTSERFGIYNDSVGIGFSVRNDPAEPVGGFVGEAVGPRARHG